MTLNIGIIGLGFVGESMLKSFIYKGVNKNNLVVYDKFKNGGIGKFEDCLICDIIFLALPTKFNIANKEYDKSSLIEICSLLSSSNFDRAIVIKSTVEPGTSDKLNNKYKNLNIIHNPEFLSANTAFHDFNNQSHIVLGKSKICLTKYLKILKNFYKKYYKIADISVCSSIESESMKSFCNSFYAVKIQFFTELYMLCDKNGSNFNTIRDLMLKNNWINPMHTMVPGTDGNISYGGLCFPKDTMALNEYMKRNNSINNVLNATIFERNLIREDNFNFDLTDKDSEL